MMSKYHSTTCLARKEPNRFNGADRGAWYAGFEVETSLAEVKFHLTEALAFTGDFHATVE